MDVYNEYALLEYQIEELEEKKSKLKLSIIKDMIEKEETKVETSVGNITLVSGKKKWTYPGYIKEAEESLKASKAKAESTREASYVEGDPFIKFTKIKL